MNKFCGRHDFGMHACILGGGFSDAGGACTRVSTRIIRTSPSDRVTASTQGPSAMASSSARRACWAIQAVQRINGLLLFMQDMMQGNVSEHSTRELGAHCFRKSPGGRRHSAQVARCH